jgi:hypothetical protein
MKLGKLQKKWVNTLKKHPERQTTERLGIIVDGKKKMCCLGQAGLIIRSCFWNKKSVLLERGSNSTGVLENNFMKIGLRSHVGGITYYPNGDPISLAELNDDGDHTWVDIAYLIEAAPELFFTKSV